MVTAGRVISVWTCTALMLIGSISVGSIPANAQTPWSGAIELAVGGGSVHARNYKSDPQAVLRATIGVRYRLDAKRSLFAEVGKEGIGFNFDDVPLCKLDGSECVPIPPDFVGTPMLVGISYTPASRLEFRVGAGGGPYHARIDPAAPRVVAAVGTAAGTFDPIPHCGLTGAVRLVMLRYQGRQVTMAPITVGIRIY